MYEWRIGHTAEDPKLLRAHCQHFSRLGWALLGQMAAMLAVQFAVSIPAALLAPQMLQNGIFLWAVSVVSAYAVGFPVFCLIIRGAPGSAGPERRPLGPAHFLQVYVLTLGLLYAVNYATLALTGMIGLLRGAPVQNPVEATEQYPVALNLLLGCVIAPVTEEIMFRKLLLDRLRPYGERFAMLASAVCFGLFHGNLNQMFYAFAIGLVFAAVVLKTGCLWQTILMHAMVNFISMGLIPLLEPLGALGEGILTVLVLGSIALGAALLFVWQRRLSFAPGPSGFSERRKWRLFWENPGMLCFFLLAAFLAYTYLATGQG